MTHQGRGGNPVELMNRALDEEREGNTKCAEAQMLALAQDFPAWDEPHVRLAELARRRGDRDAAVASYERALDRNAVRADALIGLASLHLQHGEPARAQMLLLRACNVAPHRAEGWDALGLALLATGDAAAAETALARAQTLSPHDPLLARRRTEAALAAGHGEAELLRLEVATLLDPLDVIQLTMRGVLLDSLGRRGEAIDLLEAAIVLAPGEAGPLLELCNILIYTDQTTRAETVLREAIAMIPDQPLLRSNLAVILMRLHRHGEARALLERLMAEQGEQPGLLCNLSNALVALGSQEAAVIAGEKAIALAPEMHLAWRAMAHALAYRDGASGQALLDAHRGAARCLPPVTNVAFASTPDPNRRLRLGLLSANLKTHPVGWLTVAAFEQLDTSAFEIVCLGPETTGDSIQRRFRAASAEWHDIAHKAPAALADAVRALNIDVLIDLGGYGDRGMMSACSWRAAPVQIKWVGMQNHSTGMPAMDWFITDQWETPPHLERLYSERLLRMADGYVCYTPPPYAPDVASLPALRNGYVTFGCFNNLAKITPPVIATWANILRALPQACLIMKTHQFDDLQIRARVRSAFVAAGGDSGRLTLQGTSPHRDLLSNYSEIDIVLDPFPYTGGLTTCEALWMGVPTITLPGDFFASRHATSHLSNVGLPEWVAADVDGYIAMAIERASNIPALAALRETLREKMGASPLCDAPRFGRHLGSALRHAWRCWCDEQRSLGIAA